MASDWSEELFVERVTRLVQESGKTMTAVMRQSGLAADFLSHPARTGRRIDSIYRIANTLGVSVGDLLGEPITQRMRGRKRVLASLTSTLQVVVEEYATNNGPPELRRAEQKLMLALAEGLAAVLAAVEDDAPSPQNSRAENSTVITGDQAAAG